MISGWRKYFQFILDDAQIDAVLSGFPVRILISSASGSDDRDLTFVFDELGANSLKWAAEFNNSGSQCYGCVEFWDSGSELAAIWILPTADIQDAAGQYINIYYDSTHADNTTYVGAVNSTPAQTVTAAFDGFWLTNTTGTVYDATVNNNDGAVTGASVVTDSAYGKCLSFNGTSDYIQIPDSASVSPTTAITIELFVTLDSTQPNTPRFFGKGHPGISIYNWVATSVNTIRYVLNDNWNYGAIYTPGWTLRDGNFHHIAITYDKIFIKLYADGVYQTQYAYTADISDSANPIYLMCGYYGGLIDYAKGKMGFASLSGAARNAAWIKAAFANLSDNFGSFSGELINYVTAADSIIYDIIESFTVADSIIYDIIEPFTTADSVIYSIELAVTDSIISGFEIQVDDSIVYSIYYLITAGDAVNYSIELAANDSIISGVEIQADDSVIYGFEKQIADSIIYSLSVDVVATDSIVYDIFSEITANDSIAYSIQSIDTLIIEDSIIYHIMNPPGLPASGSVSGGGIIVVNGVIPPGSVPADGQFVFDATHGV